MSKALKSNPSIQTCIQIRGAHQNNLKNLDLDLPLNELIVITGVSGSGKSSLAFDTVYSEGQRRYVETFSPYARQFLDRMDKPQAERIDGIPPAIAIDQTNPVRTSRSTVGTMTELNDHIKLLFARAARLHCQGCGQLVRRDDPHSIWRALCAQWPADSRVQITFAVTIPNNFSEVEIVEFLAAQGYTRIHAHSDNTLEVIQDRLRIKADDADRRARAIEALEAAFRSGRGQLCVQRLDAQRDVLETRRYSADLHCADCDIHYQEPIPNTFSFNSPVGACPTCRGFGRIIGIDYDLVIPDPTKTLKEGAIKPWQTDSNRECQLDLIKYARKRGVPVDKPWRELSAEQQAWVIEGEGGWRRGVWYGVQRFFDWLESKAYKMHVRVLLSKYRAYHACPDCRGARLKPDSLLWRLGSQANADAVLPPEQRFKPAAVRIPDAIYQRLDGLTLHDVMLLPIARCQRFFAYLQLPAPLDEATELLLGEIRARLQFLVDVGLSYLTLDRQSRTLSGGEVQRINLTTALGTALVNTLFVLDEPSIGLHPRDMQRIIGVLHRLRDAGNSLLVVEHDPQVMLAADRILDLGPGPGERGGEIVFFGSPQALLAQAESLTAQYLAGCKRISAKTAARRTSKKTSQLKIWGAAAHNLKHLDIVIPLHRLVCITGVSGSGKSTLAQDVLFNALLKLKGKPKDTAGAHRAIDGHELIADAVLVDQSPIGKTTRSNPASYIGALDAIRKRFAAEPLARERGYTAGTFSFNSGNGRCPSCAGNGFEYVEMQFLSDVYLRCPDCDGRRYRPEVLEVKLYTPGAEQGKSMADVLDMTVREALDYFAAVAEVQRVLEPLAAVGLDYLRLGQPVPTLSGGEAQRLKLAGHLALTKRAKNNGEMLFIFDEPTTGLHFEDIAKLLQALQRLIEAGHSVLVIEHNLDVIRAADWLIDLGPEGGEDGGELVCAGTPRHVMKHPGSHTGAALRDYEQALKGLRQGVSKVAEARPAGRSLDAIRIHKAREHNLKNIDLEVPRQGFTVLTGVSGSGKSTVAFDIVFAEGQRRYLESLNAYARQFVQPAAKPDIDALYGIPPTVAIEQRSSRGGRKSTVATLTEIYHFLRLLFVKLGVQHCPECDIPIQAQSMEVIAARILRQYRGKAVTLLAPLIVARKGYYTDLAKWAAGKGYEQLRVDGELMPTRDWPRLDRFKEHDIELPVETLTVTPAAEQQLRSALRQALDYGKGVVSVLAQGKTQIFSTQRACPGCGRSFNELDPRLFSYNSKHGWCPSCYGTGLQLAGFDAEQSGEEIGWNAWYEGAEHACRPCEGQRLRPEALAVRFQDRSIAALAGLSVTEAEYYFRALKLKGRDAEIARDILAELRARLAFLREVGLSYLSLDRAAPSLSGGEAQRIRLAAQLGSNLRGVCYILDEPTIGLHPRDNQMLLDTLEKLERKGNTVLVVEHDEDTIRRAEHIIDLGPGAGWQGGEVVATGQIDAIMANPRSLTGQFLRQPLPHPLLPSRPVQSKSAQLEIRGGRLNNINDLDVSIPLGRLVCVTGVSGSGKSTLVRQILHTSLKSLLAEKKAQGCRELKGWQQVQRVLEVDQTPIGKTPRSCPATYVGFWDRVRRLFADTQEARLRGYTASRFSFNTAGGRCASCEGQGLQKIAMSFLPDVKVLCESCGGLRFDAETLAVTLRGKSVGAVLNMSVDEAAEFFSAHRSIHHALCLLQDVGLGYLTLGQQSPTLSGGEAQRIKLVTELAKAQPAALRSGKSQPPHTLYILDEPTIGLHMADVEKLIRVLHRLVDAGHSVVLIEHNLDIIAEADWIIDMGPEGGAAGGRVVAHGYPRSISKSRTPTAKFLRAFLRKRDQSVSA